MERSRMNQVQAGHRMGLATQATCKATVEQATRNHEAVKSGNKRETVKSGKNKRKQTQAIEKELNQAFWKNGFKKNIPFQKTKRIMAKADKIALSRKQREQLYQDGEVSVAGEESTHYILVSKQLFKDLKEIASNLKRLRKMTRTVFLANGFRKIVKRYIYSPLIQRLIKRVIIHLENLGMSPPTFRSYDEFVFKVVKAVPELSFINESIFNIVITNPFYFRIKNVACYCDKYFTNNVSQQTTWLSGSVEYIYNLPFEKWLSQQRRGTVAKVRITPKLKKANVTKFDMNKEDFPLLNEDKAEPSNVLKFTKQTYAKVLKIKKTSYAKSDKAQERTEVDFFKSLPPPPKLTKWERYTSILTKDTDCLRCAAKQTDKIFPENFIRFALKAKCECTIKAIRQSDEIEEFFKDTTPSDRVMIWSQLNSLPRLFPMSEEQESVIAKKKAYFIEHYPDETQGVNNSWDKMSSKLGSLFRAKKKEFQESKTYGTLNQVADAFSTFNPKNVENLKEIVSKVSDTILDDRVKELLEGGKLGELMDKGLISEETRNSLLKVANQAEQFSAQMIQAASKLENTAALGHSLLDKWRNGTNGLDSKVTLWSKICGFVLSIPIYLELNNKGRLLLFASQVFMMDLPQIVYTKMQDLYFSIVSKVEEKVAEVPPEQRDFFLNSTPSYPSSHYSSSTINAEAQDGMDFGDVVGPLSQLISLGLVSTVSKGTSASVKQITEAGNVARSFVNVKTFGDAVKKGLEESHKRLFSVVTGLPPGIENMEEVAEGLTDWLDLVKETVESPDWLGRYMEDNKNQQVLEDLIQLGDNILLKLFKSTSGEATNMKAYMQKALSVMRKLATAMVTARAGSKDRVLPVSIIFHGPPGLGKTQTINQLVADLFSLQSPEYKSQFKSLEDIKYNKPETSDYYDGYMNHFAYVQDEIFSITNDEDVAADCKKIMELVQESSPPLNMANLESKGKVFFQSKYLLFTTNKEQILNDLPVINHQAIRRRLHFSVYMTLHPNFQNEHGRLDIDAWVAYAQQRGLNSNIPHFATFHVVREDGQRYSVTYPELVDAIHEQHLVNVERFEQNQENQIRVFQNGYVLDQPEMELFQAGQNVPDPFRVEDGPRNQYIPRQNRNRRGRGRGNNRHHRQRYENAVQAMRQADAPPTNANRPRSVRSAPQEPTGRLNEGFHDRASLPGNMHMNPQPDTYGIRGAYQPMGPATLSERVEAMRLSISSTKKDIIRDARVATAWKTPESDKYDAICAIYGIQSDEEFMCFYFFLYTCKTQAEVERAMTQAFGRPYRVPANVTLNNLENTALNPDIRNNLQKNLGLPITTSIRVGWRRFIQKIKDHPWTCLLIGASTIGITVLAIMAVANYYKANKADAKAAKEGKYDPGQSKKNGSKRFARKGGPLSKQESGKQEAEPENDAEDERVNGFNYDVTTMEENDELDEAYEQACQDENWERQFFKIVTHLYYVEVAHDEWFSSGKNRVRGIAVCNDYMLIPKHLFRNIEDGFLRISQGGTDTKVFLIKDLTIKEIGERWDYNDVTLVRFPKNKLAATDIVDLFCTHDEQMAMTDTYGELIVIDSQHKLVMRHAAAISTDFTRKVDVQGQVLKRGYRYAASTLKGDCGSPLIRWNANAKTKILGFHVAGSDQPINTGYATIIDQDWLKEQIAIVGIPLADPEEELTPLQGGAYDVIPEMNVLGHTENRVNFPVGPTKIIHSPFYEAGFGEPLTAPAKRTSGGAESTLAKVLKKFRSKAPYVDRQIVQQITQHLAYSHFCHPKRDRTIYSYEESLNVLKSIRSIDCSTSMGYPWSRYQKKKSDYVEYVEKLQKYRFLNQEIPERCAEVEQAMRENRPHSFIFTNCLKDERLPLEKVEQGKVRMFMICPFDLTILVRRFYGAFVDHIHSKIMELGVCVTIDPHSEQWHQLAHQLLRYDDHMFAIDFSNWDRSIPVEFLGVFFDLADIFYSDEHYKVRQAIRQAILQPVYQLKYFRYRVIAGNPSGCPVTTELNSIANLAMTIYAIQQIGFSVPEVISSTFVATYGDDSVISTSLQVEVDELLHQITKLGLIATNARKDGSVRKEPLSEIEFLKRRFYFHGGRYYAPLKMDSIMESLLWMRRGKDSLFNFQCTINNAFVDLEQYPPHEVTNEYWKILNFCQLTGYKYELSSHAVTALTYSTREESLLNPLENFSIRFSMFIYRLLKVQKIAAKRQDFCDKISARYVGIDLATKAVFMESNVFYHVGFRMYNRTLCKEMELTFSDKGVAWIECAYEPTFSYEVEFTKKQLVDSFQDNPYDKVRNNCIMWCEYVLKVSGQLSKIGEEHRRIYSRFVAKTRADNPFLWGDYGDTSNYVFVKDDSLLAWQPAEEQSDAITDEDLAPIVRFLDSQEVINRAPTRDIDSLLSSHALIEQLKWEKNGTYDGSLAKIPFPGKLSTIKQYECKLKFTALLRADIEVIITISDVTLYSGSLVVAWIPCADQGFPKGVELTAKQMTGMEHVRVVLPDQNQVKFTIPFNHYKNYISQTNREANEMGELWIRIVNPLKCPKNGSTSVYVKVMANFTNVQAVITTPLTAESKWVKGEDVYPRFAAKQDGEDEEKVTKDLISGPATTIANIADLVSGIPVLSSVAGSVSVISRAVAGVARYMGLSKPRSLAIPRVQVPGVFQNIGYSDALDMGKVLGLDPKNHVVIQPSLFGSLIDQMSINYLIRIPTLVLIKEWSNIDAINKTLMVIPVHPYIGSAHADTSYSGGVIQTSYLGYLATCFKFWRGTIRFRIEIIATEMHKGSLVIGFIPKGCVNGNGPFDYETTIKEIIDVSGYTVKEFEIPFISTAMMNRCGCPFDVMDLEDDIATGTLVIKIDRPLMKSGIVSDAVQINIWTFAGEDFTFSFPHLGCISKLAYTDATKAEEQSMGDTFTTVSQRHDLVMGETVHNIRELLKVSAPKHTSSRVFKTGTMQISFPAHTFTGQDNHSEISETYYTHLLRLYRFSRGSIRHKVMFSSLNAKVSAIAAATRMSEYEWEKGELLEGAPWCTTHGKVAPCLEYEIPFYNKYKMEVHGQSSSERSAVIQVEMLNNKEAYSRFVLYESIGDDFSAGYMMGPPLLYQRMNNLYTLLWTIKTAVKGAWKGKVDSYYDPEFVTAKMTIVKDGSKYTRVVMHQEFYYTDYMPRYTLLVADGEAESLSDVIELKNETGLQVNKLICFIRRDEAEISHADYTYDSAATPLNGAWIGVHASDTIRFYTFSRVLSKPKNVKRVVLGIDLLGEIFKQEDLHFRGKVKVTYT